MARKKKAPKQEPEHFKIKTEVQVHGRWLRPGTEFTVHGVKGRLRFIRHVTNTNTNTDWVEAFSINKQFRAFYPDRITTVHTKTRTRENNNG